MLQKFRHECAVLAQLRGEFKTPLLWGLHKGRGAGYRAAVYLGKVIGTVVATQKVDKLQGIKLLLVQPIDHDHQPTRGPEVACDTVQAGVGDLVYLVGSREAALAMQETFVPIDAAVVGIVDQM
jgi:ethanolamine utilization protein EutN